MRLRPLVLTTATSTTALAGADLVVRERFRFPRWSCTPGRVLRRRRGLERGRGLAHRLGELPGPVHAALGRRRRARASRLEAPPDHAARLGRLVRDQVRRLRLRRAHGARLAEARRPRALDRGPPRAPRRELVLERPCHRASRPASPPTASSSRSATTRSRTSAHTSALPSRPRSTACTVRSSGAYRVQNVAARNRVVLTNTMPSGLNRGLRRPAALPRARADDDDRRATASGIDPAELRRRNLIRGRRVPVPHAVGRALRLRRLRGLPRRRARARALRRAARGRRGGARRGPARRRRDRMRRRAVDLEHGLHHPRRAGRRRAACRSRATPRAARSRSPRSEASPCARRRRRRARVIAR